MDKTNWKIVAAVVVIAVLLFAATVALGAVL